MSKNNKKLLIIGDPSALRARLLHFFEKQENINAIVYAPEESLTNACKAAGTVLYINPSNIPIKNVCNALNNSQRLIAVGHIHKKHISTLCKNWIILQPTHMYGYEKDTVLSPVIHHISTYTILPVAQNETTINPVHIDDVVTAVDDAYTQEKTVQKHYILKGEKELTVKQFILTVSHMTGKSIFVLPLPKKIFNSLVFVINKISTNSIFKKSNIFRKTEQNEQKSTNDSAEKDFAFSPRTLKSGIAQYLNQQSNNQ